MSELRVVVVDDEQAARDKLKLFLMPVVDFTFVGEAENGLTAERLISRLTPEIIFLDIQMPELDGISLARRLQSDLTSRIVFTTAYEEHAVNAFELNAVDYLLKPFDQERFDATLDRLRAGNPQLINEHTGSLYQSTLMSRLMLKTEKGIEVTDTNDIIWAEASGGHVKICEHNNAFFARIKFSSLIEKLDARQFCRVHRSYLVNLAQVERIVPIHRGDCELHMKGNFTIPLSRHYREQFFSCFIKSSNIPHSQQPDHVKKDPT